MHNKIKKNKEIDWVITEEMKEIEELRRFKPARSTKACCVYHKTIPESELSIPGKGWALK
jgi:hypothetical protein